MHLKQQSLGLRRNLEGGVALASAAPAPRKRKREDPGISGGRKAPRHEPAKDDIYQRDISKFLDLPSADEVKECYRRFHQATSNEAVATSVCGVCGRESCNLEGGDSNISVDISELPNSHRLQPHEPHPAHFLIDGKLFDPKGVILTEGAAPQVRICKECIGDLKKAIDRPPRFALANNLWIGEIPIELKRLTFPEQLLIAHLYPRVYVFKLFPKRQGAVADESQLQRAMRGNVTTYAFDQESIANMLSGKLLPRPVEVLASVISVTYIGRGALPKNWLKSTFRVRRQFVREALNWLRINNPKYYGGIEISDSRIEVLPEDDVPDEIMSIVRQSTDIGVLSQENDNYVPQDGEFSTNMQN